MLSALAERYVNESQHTMAGDMDTVEEWALKQPRPMAWRAKLVNGSLWVRLLVASGRWAERSSVLRLLLLAMQSKSTLPDIDFVYVSDDQDPSPRGGKGPLIMTNAHARGQSSLPLPEFTFAGWFTNTPPWCELFETLHSAAAALPWAERLDRAFFSGSLTNGAHRKSLGQLLTRSAEARELLDVRNVHSTFFSGWVAERASRGTNVPGVAATGPAEACRYKYALSVPGYGYASRLKQLLACGTAVIHVAHPWNEFFFPLLVPGAFAGVGAAGTHSPRTAHALSRA